MTNPKTETIVFEPNPGPQTQFLETTADIAIYGGSAGGGKTYGALLETLGNYQNPGFRALILRRHYRDIDQEGGIWDDSKNLYPYFGASDNYNKLRWQFPSGARVSFDHMNDVRKDHLRYKSAALALIIFEELTEFESHQFWYMLSRNRSTCGIRPYMRATTNPMPGWLADLLIAGGYIGDDGYAIEEMSGVIRWIIRQGDDIHWFDSREEAIDEFPNSKPLSFTFIRAKLEDNPKLTDEDPEYQSRIDMLPRVDRERLGGGNWKIQPAAGLYFPREKWNIAHRVPGKIDRIVRAWDLAGTEKKEDSNDPDWTRGVLLGYVEEGFYYILDVKSLRGSPAQVRELVKSTAESDRQQWGRVTTVVPQDPAQAGKDQADRYVTLLAGHNIRRVKPLKNKVARAEAYSAQMDAGKFLLVNAPWNESFISEHEMFPEGNHDDQVDAAADAFNYISSEVDTWEFWEAMAE